MNKVELVEAYLHYALFQMERNSLFLSEMYLKEMYPYLI